MTTDKKKDKRVWLKIKLKNSTSSKNKELRNQRAWMIKRSLRLWYIKIRFKSKRRRRIASSFVPNINVVLVSSSPTSLQSWSWLGASCVYGKQEWLGSLWVSTSRCILCKMNCMPTWQLSLPSQEGWYQPFCLASLWTTSNQEVKWQFPCSVSQRPSLIFLSVWWHITSSRTSGYQLQECI